MGPSSRESRLALLREAKKLKAEGKSRLHTYKSEESEAIYDEVDEVGFRKIVQDRMMGEDFVVDDNGLGYADNGIDDWDRTGQDEQSQSESEEDNRKRKKKTSKAEKDATTAKKQRNAMDKFVAKSTTMTKNQAPKIVSKEEEDDFLTGLLDQVESTVVNRPKQKPSTRVSLKSFANSASKRRGSPPLRGRSVNTTTSLTYDRDDPLPPSSPRLEGVSEDMPSSPSDLRDKSQTAAVPENLWTGNSGSAITMSEPEPSDYEDDFDMEIEKPMGLSGSEIKRVNLAASKPILPKLEPKEGTKLAVEESKSWMAMNSNISVAVASSPVRDDSPSYGKIELEEVRDENGSIKMFWTDYYEMDDRLILIGKTKHKDSYVSCMAQVTGVMRKLYFLPRETAQDDKPEDRILKDVQEELKLIFKKARIDWRAKPCRRKYAFDLPDVPHESTYLQVQYPYTGKQLPQDLSGETFSRVFGTNTSLFEQFVLARRVMGPCWLEFKNATSKDVSNMSWCKVELGVTSINDVTTLMDSDTPPMTLMSIALRTVMNQKEDKQEIVAISGRVFANVAHDTTESPDNLRPYVFTIVRPVQGSVFPTSFESEVKRNGRGTISLQQSEVALVSSFLDQVEKYDPDVFIGHNLDSVDLNLLLHRMKERKVRNWHRMGRIRRSDWPRASAGMMIFADRQAVTGRLLCDLGNDLGKSVMTKCQSWSLTEMCSLVLGVKRYETEDNLANLTDSAQGLLEYVSHCELDTHFIAALALKTQMLPLTKQLTNLAGNSWARTLSGTRSERNEYILLHEFIKNKYVVPDKAAFQQKVQNEDNEEEGKKKDKYKGGLVFEPEKGLYDKFVIVMDFNSLYPSIIQEFNICFTTVDRSNCLEADDQVPEPPPSEVPQGILPKLIATLVDRRRQVKQLMKDKSATPVQRSQWDIKQLALKLTANSMYGCLGYTRSRFYARPLAMLTTHKGREILMDTKELAESMQLKVVYGDTDSVMINTNCTSYADAVKIGQEFKKAVNERYRLLEIDIDNVFERLLMQAKKKYAALNVTEVNGKLETRVEVKGLDMRRREFCALSKDASSYALDQILSGEQTETVLERIHTYLRELGNNVRAGKVPAPKFIVHTKLSKNPEQYPGGKSMPAVQVALKRKARGEKILANDVIQFIIAAGEAPNPADRAAPASDLTKPGSALKPDYEWYLSKQILPPLERLCASIEGTDAVRLADCLGLDTRKYLLANAQAAVPAIELGRLESTVSDAERFQNAKRLPLQCASCACTFTFEGLAASRAMCSPGGVRCPSCQTAIHTFGLVAAVELQIRSEISRYYEGWVVCDDSSCGNRTRQISVYGKRCIGKDGLARSCRGVMQWEFGDRELYNQLLYYDTVFDVDKAKGQGDAEIDALAEHNRPAFAAARAAVAKYLGDCGRRYVDFHSIFGFM